jgi:hypothetical protein
MGPAGEKQRFARQEMVLGRNKNSPNMFAVRLGGLGLDLGANLGGCQLESIL